MNHGMQNNNITNHMRLNHIYKINLDKNSDGTLVLCVTHKKKLSFLINMCINTIGCRHQIHNTHQTSKEVEYDFLMWICFTDPPNGHKVCIMQLNNLYNHTFSIFLFNALKILRNVQDVIINMMKLLNMERIVSVGYLVC